MPADPSEGRRPPGGVATRTLYILRHADAAPGAPDVHDFDRPLTPLGHRQSVAIAELLGRAPIDYVLCSSATRTRQTVGPLLAARAGAIPTVAFDKRIYSAAVSTLVRVLEQIPESARSAMIVGHNPGMVELVSELLGDLPELVRGFPKAGLAEVSVEPAWSVITAGPCRLVSFVEPAVQ